MTPPVGPVVGRFAPSPTGAMHLGNARTALLAWGQARAAGGRFLLRFEDLDATRVRAFAYEATRRDLAWLGLDWDEEVVQSERVALYEAALARLDTYFCDCTRRQIAEAVSAPHGAEAVYPGICRSRGLRAGARRWRVPDGAVCALDPRLGELCQNLASEVGDFVLRRADGAISYHLAVVVDDADAGVTDVVRGDDLWTSTPRQVALQRALGLPTPRYRHVPLLRDFRGERLAKRGGAPSVSALRDLGADPGHVVADLARSLGWDVPDVVGPADLLPLLARLDGTNLDSLSKN